MIVQLHLAPSSSLADFADRHGLIMTVRERADRKTSHYPPYSARFENVEIKHGQMLEGCSGNGDTPEEAIRFYTEKISGKTIAIDAFKPTRREIQVPRLFV